MTDRATLRLAPSSFPWTRLLVRAFGAAGLALALGLVACSGGGGGGGGTPTPTVTAPSITQQPVSPGSVLAGAQVSFTVAATGTAPLSYQWRKGSVPLSGATATTFSLASAQVADSGTYDVVVSNAAGSATSAAAILTVTAPQAPSITQQPASQSVLAGAQVSFTVAATGTAPLSYQWRKGGTALTGATATTYTIASAQAGDAGSYDVVVSNAAGSVPSAAAVLTVTLPAPTFGGFSPTGGPAGTVVTITGTNLAAATSVKFNGTPAVAFTPAATQITATVPAGASSGPILVTTPGGTVGSGASAFTVSLGNRAPAITSQPPASAQAGTVYTYAVTTYDPDGTTVTLTAPIVPTGASLAGGVLTWTPSGAQANVEQSFKLTASDGQLTQDQTWKITPAPGLQAPYFTIQSDSQTVEAGTSVTFRARPAGTAPIALQWYRNGQKMVNETSEAITLPSVSPSDSGSVFYAVAKNAVTGTGTGDTGVESTRGTLTVNPPAGDGSTAAASLEAREGATLTVLSDGRALYLGGKVKTVANPTPPPRPSQIINLTTGSTVLSLDPVLTPRSKHTATLLANGKVLVVGGTTDGATGIQLVDPTQTDPALAVQTIAALNPPRFNHGAVRLPGGRILILGGTRDEAGTDGTGTESTGLVLTESGTTVTAPQVVSGTLGIARPKRPQLVPVTLGATSYAYIFGGTTSDRFNRVVSRLNLQTLAIDAGYATNLLTTRSQCTATDLANGKILVVGGTGDAEALTTQAEIFDPASDASTYTAGAPTQKRKGHIAAKLSTQKILLLGGGTTQAEEYDYAANAFLLPGATSAGGPEPEAPAPAAPQAAPSLAAEPVPAPGEPQGGRTVLRVVPPAAGQDPGPTSAPLPGLPVPPSTGAYEMLWATSPAGRLLALGGSTVLDGGITDPGAAQYAPSAASQVASPPVILSGPLPVTAGVGETATFGVIATGKAPLAYAWRKNGTVIPGATGASYTTPALATGDANASFSVTVSNAAGSANPQPAAAVLTLLNKPVISSLNASPTSITVPGQSVRLYWTVTGAQSLSIDNGVGSVTGLTQVTVNPTVTTTYTLKATNADGSVSRSITVILGGFSLGAYGLPNTSFSRPWLTIVGSGVNLAFQAHPASIPVLPAGNYTLTAFEVSNLTTTFRPIDWAAQTPVASKVWTAIYPYFSVPDYLDMTKYWGFNVSITGGIPALNPANWVELILPGGAVNWFPYPAAYVGYLSVLETTTGSHSWRANPISIWSTGSTPSPASASFNATLGSVSAFTVNYSPTTPFYNASSAVPLTVARGANLTINGYLPTPVDKAYVLDSTSNQPVAATIVLTNMYQAVITIPASCAPGKAKWIFIGGGTPPYRQGIFIMDYGANTGVTIQ